MSAHADGKSFEPNVGCALVIVGVVAFWFVMVRVML